MQAKSSKSKKNELGLDQNEIIGIVMKLVVPKIEGLVKEAFNSFADDYLRELNAVKYELEQLRTSQQFNSDKFDDLSKEIKKMATTNKKNELTATKLSKELTDLEKVKKEEFFKIDQLEQYGRRLNLEFDGVPNQKNENVTDIVIEISKKLDVEVRRSDISIAHRLPPKKFKANDSASWPPTIIAQFTNKRMRNEIFAKRKKAKEMTDFPVDEMTNLYINENLTQFRKRLFWSTKQTAKAKKFKFFWTTNGQIWIKKNESEDAIPIRCEDDLDSL